MYTSLIQAARNAARNAYCPYSHFPVGAALLVSDGRIFLGCNVENAAFGLTLCAERNAITSAIAEGVRSFQAIAIVGGSADSPAYPCGSCRQVLAEFCPPTLPVAIAPLDPADGDGLVLTLAQLLPYNFSL